MPIPVQTVIDRLKFNLDAEGQGDYYRFDRDFKPAINSAVEFIVSVVNSAFGDKKIGEEIFRELTHIRVFQTNQFSRFQMDPILLGHSVWTIFSVYPEPIVTPSPATIVCDPLVNLFIDGDGGKMETGITGLSAFTGDTLIQSLDEAFEGSFSAKYTAATQSPTIVERKMIGTSTGVNITKGVVYEMKARVFVKDPTPSTILRGTGIRIDLDPSGSGAIGTETKVFWNISSPFDQFFEISSKAFANSSTKIFPEIVQAIYTSASVQPIYIDKIEFGCVTDPEDSLYFDNLTYLNSVHSAKRLTLEEWNENKGNPFMPGNTIFDTTKCPDLLSYAYINFADYDSTNYKTATAELEIGPVLNKKLVAVAYAQKHDDITATTDDIQFPLGLTNLITDKALDYIARKQGDQTTIHSITTEDIATLIRTVL